MVHLVGIFPSVSVICADVPAGGENSRPAPAGSPSRSHHAHHPPEAWMVNGGRC